MASKGKVQGAWSFAYNTQRGPNRTPLQVTPPTLAPKTNGKNEIQRLELHRTLHFKSNSTFQKKSSTLSKSSSSKVLLSPSYRGRNRAQNGRSQQDSSRGRINCRTFQGRLLPLSPLEVPFPAVLEDISMEVNCHLLELSS